MAATDLDEELRDLAGRGERLATPITAERVRRLGTSRRRRRHAAGAVAVLAVLAIGGGTVLAQAPGLTDRTPPPVASGAPSAPASPPAAPTPTPAAPRTVGEEQLLRPADVPTRGGPDLVIAPPGMGRVADEISVCVPGGLSVLGATGSASRDFRYPGQEVTAIQTVALQFADVAAAERAEQTVLGWIDNCAATVEEKGNTLLDRAGEPVRVEVDTPTGTSGEFAVVPTYEQRAGDGADGEGFFETLGVTRVEDRMMLTVEVVVGMDDNVSLEPGGDPENGMPAHPQFGLVTSAAKRLAS